MAYETKFHKNKTKPTILIIILYVILYLLERKCEEKKYSELNERYYNLLNVITHSKALLQIVILWVLFFKIMNEKTTIILS
jgi:hypothetical protein